MDVGMILPRVDPGGRPVTSDRFIESIRRVERVGLASAWITDSLGRGFPNPDPLITLGAAAVVTNRVRLGTSILQLAIRNPFELAHRVTTTQFLAGERLHLGVGAGSTLADFRATGMSFEDRFGTFESSLTTMRALWRGDEVGGSRLDLFDSTKGGPKLLIGSWASGSWIPRAAREFDGWVGSARKTSWKTIEHAIRVYREAGGRWAVLTNVVIDPTADEIDDNDDTPLGPCGPRVARDRLHRLRDLGFDEVVVRTFDHTDDVIEGLADLALTAATP